jgi:hypothetical protein
MKLLTIELTKGTPRQFQSIGWKTAKAGDCRWQVFAIDENGSAFVVTPKPAVPDFYEPLRRVRAVFSCEPFPEAVCIEISPCRLLPPPCYRSRKDFDAQSVCHWEFEPWKSIYWQAHGQALVLKPTDDSVLQKELEKWLARMRAAYERAAASWRDKIAHAKAATLAELGFQIEEQRAKEVLELDKQLSIVESENPIEGVVCKGRLKLTLEEVKRGCEGIRDAWLHQQWAKETGVDLTRMARERRLFRDWLVAHTGTPALVYHSATQERRHEIEPPDFGGRFDNNQLFLEACAPVRYRVRFADNAGTVVYLADCELRKELTADELDEVRKLTAANTPHSNAPKPQHTPELQFEYVNIQGTEWRKAGPQMVRRRELAEHQRTTKDDSAFRKTLDAYKERWFYLTKEVDQLRKAAQGKKPRIAAMFDITDWDSSWRPRSNPSWVHPGKKSEPVRAKQS